MYEVVRITLCSLGLLMCWMSVPAQNPANGVAADDVDAQIQNSVVDLLKVNQGQQWNLSQSSQIGRATSRLVYETALGVRRRVLLLTLEYMRTPADAEARLDFYKRSVAVAGKATSGIGQDALGWNQLGNSRITFRQGSVVAEVVFRDADSVDDLSQITTTFAQDVALGIANAGQ